MLKLAIKSKKHLFHYTQRVDVLGVQTIKIEVFTGDEVCKNLIGWTRGDTAQAIWGLINELSTELEKAQSLRITQIDSNFGGLPNTKREELEDNGKAKLPRMLADV